MSSTDFHARFGDVTDPELLEMLREGSATYRPDAWAEIVAEAKRRRISLDDVGEGDDERDPR